MPEIIKISDAESEVMKVLWVHNKPMTERQILDILSENTDWSPTTIKTLIKRLYDKGAIKREKKEVFYYWPVLMQSEFAKERTIDLLDKVFGGNVKSLVSTMLSHDILSEDDVDALNNYWQERRQKNE